MSLEQFTRKRLMEKRAGVIADLARATMEVSDAESNLENVKEQVENFQWKLTDIDSQLAGLPGREP